MAKVFVVNHTPHDYSTAASFGELVFITDGNVPIFKTDLVYEILTEGLKDFSDEDYILFAGPTILCVIASTIVFRTHPTAKFLVFDAKKQGYCLRHLSV